MSTDNSGTPSQPAKITSTFVATAPRTKKFLSKRVLTYLLKLGIAVAVMIMLVRRLEINEIISTFNSARLWLIYLALLLLLPNIYIQFYKWRYLVRLLKPNVTNSEALKSLLTGMTLGFITPGRVGEFGRALFIYDCSWVKLLGITGLDKLYSIAVLIFWGAIGLLVLVADKLELYFSIPLIFFTLFTLGVIYYILFHPDFFRSFLYSLNIILPFRDKIKLLLSSLDNFKRRQAVMLLVLTFCFYSIFFIQFYLLILAFQPAALLLTFCAIAAAMLAKSMLPISIGDLGIRESAAVFFLGKIGLLESTAFNASILLFVINLLIPSLVGLLLILKQQLTFLKNGSNSNSD